MGNLLFSPSGRINPSEFMRGAIILIVIGFLLSLPGILGMKSLDAILGIISIALIYPWVVIWIKRYHDAGKSGWMCLIPIVIFCILLVIVTALMLGGEISQMFEMASSGASQAEQQEASEQIMSGKQLPVALASTAVSAAIAFMFNSLIKRDAHENQFGPAS